MAEMRVVRSELILGAPKSGKTARAEALAQAWLARSPQHRAVYIAMAQAGDEEKPQPFEPRLPEPTGTAPRLARVDDPLELAHAIGPHSRADTLIVADCLTLWLTAQLMPAVASPHPDPLPEGEGMDSSSSLSPWERAGVRAIGSTIAGALRSCAGPIVLISNEPGLEDLPAGPDQKSFWDSLGGMNQEAAAACERVTLMSAGRPLTLKGSS